MEVESVERVSFLNSVAVDASYRLVRVTMGAFTVCLGARNSAVDIIFLLSEMKQSTQST